MAEVEKLQNEYLATMDARDVIDIRHRTAVFQDSSMPQVMQVATVICLVPKRKSLIEWFKEMIG